MQQVWATLCKTAHHQRLHATGLHMTEIDAIEEKHDEYFTCPQCGGHYFGRDTVDAMGTTLVLDTVRCHDQNKAGCDWHGEWPK